MNLESPNSARSYYEALRSTRQFFVDRAEENAAFTIPSVFPREDRSGNRSFVPPRSGVAARGVNHLAARLTQVLLPSSGNFFRFVPDREARAVIESFEPQERAEVEANLQQMERDVQLEIETEAVRVGTNEMMQHLIITGNAVMYRPAEEGLVMFPLNQFVVERDREDNLLRLVIREQVALAALPEHLRELVEEKLRSSSGGPSTPTSKHTKDVDIYTHVWRDGKKYYSRQEVCGIHVPDSDGEYLPEELPWVHLRWAKVTGEAYGRSFIEEYISTVKNVEYLTKAIVEFARAASRVLPMVKPHATTSIKDINEAANGEAVYGNPDDISFLQVQKLHDFRVANETLATETRALQGVFLMNAAVQRHAERVTAEEFRIMAAELESALGGVYSILSKDFQLPLIRGIVLQMQRRGALPRFSQKLKSHILPTILTGVDALGRRADLERFAQAVQVLSSSLGPDALAGVIDVRKVVDFVFTNSNVNAAQLLKSEEQLAAEQQQAQQQAMMQQAIQSGLGPAVSAAASNPEAVAAMRDAAAQQQQGAEG